MTDLRQISQVLGTEGVLAPSNLWLLYAGMVIAKLLHELGHGVACKRTECKERKSPFNSKPKIEAALREVVQSLDVETIRVLEARGGAALPRRLRRPA